MPATEEEGKPMTTTLPSNAALPLRRSNGDHQHDEMDPARRSTASSHSDEIKDALVDSDYAYNHHEGRPTRQLLST